MNYVMFKCEIDKISKKLDKIIAKLDEKEVKKEETKYPDPWQDISFKDATTAERYRQHFESHINSFGHITANEVLCDISILKIPDGDSKGWKCESDMSIWYDPAKNHYCLHFEPFSWSANKEE